MERIGDNLQIPNAAGSLSSEFSMTKFGEINIGEGLRPIDKLCMKQAPGMTRTEQPTGK